MKPFSAGLIAFLSLASGQVLAQERDIRDSNPPVFDHTGLPDTENTAGPYGLSVIIQDSDGVASAQIQYRVMFGGVFSQWQISPLVESAFSWDGIIPGHPPGTFIQYYFQASDMAIPPNFGSSSFYSFTILAPPPDITPPDIVHTPLTNTEDIFGPYEVVASISDENGVESSTLFYRLFFLDLVTQWTETPMSPMGGDLWSGSLPGQPEGTTLNYYIQARDLADDANQASSPVVFFDIVAAPNTAPVITHIPLGDTCNSAGPYTVSAFIQDEDGVATPLLSYRHVLGEEATQWFNLPMSVDGPNSWTAQIAGLGSATGVQYWIQVSDLADPPLQKSTPLLNFDIHPAPSVPELQISQLTSTLIRIEWAEDSLASAYRVEQSEGLGQGFTLLSVTTENSLIQEHQEGDTGLFRVRALCE